MDLVDSRKQKLNSGQIILIALKSGVNDVANMPLQVVMPAILSELSQPNVKVKQIGNTLFEVIVGNGKEAFFKAFNADTGPNFAENSKEFCVWAKHVMGLHILVTEFSGDEITRLFKIISMNPPMPDMGYQVLHMQSGKTRIVLNLGA